MKQNKFYLSSFVSLCVCLPPDVPDDLLDFEQAIALAKLTHVTQPAAGVLYLPLDAELEAAKCGRCREFSLD